MGVRTSPSVVTNRNLLIQYYCSGGLEGHGSVCGWWCVAATAPDETAVVAGSVDNFLLGKPKEVETDDIQDIQVSLRAVFFDDYVVANIVCSCCGTIRLEEAYTQKVV